MNELFGKAEEPFRCEYSENNHFMFWRAPQGRKQTKNFVPPTEMIKMTFQEWYAKATQERTSKDDPHWYFRASACSKSGGCPAPDFQEIFSEVPIFQPEESLFIAAPKKQRGVHCRFGMTGVIAENHFDGSRNMIALLGGERRYILSHPSNCRNMALFPKDHPSGRHSAVDWSDPDFSTFPAFEDVRSHEVVLQPGDVLYLPTHWFHYIISLGFNYQCNTRSGKNYDYDSLMDECGF
jgi:hypothetical protein